MLRQPHNRTNSQRQKDRKILHLEANLSNPRGCVALGVSKPGILFLIDEFKVENAVPILNMWEETSQLEMSQTHVYDNYR
jgi:hypothetical protein